MNLMDEVIAEINKRLAKNPQVLAAYLFGSRARSNAKPESDYDIGLLLYPDKNYSYHDAGRVISELGEAGGVTGVTVINDALPSLKYQVISPQRVIFCRDHNLRAEYEVSVYNCYYDDVLPYIDIGVSGGRSSHPQI